MIKEFPTIPTTANIDIKTKKDIVLISMVSKQVWYEPKQKGGWHFIILNWGTFISVWQVFFRVTFVGRRMATMTRSFVYRPGVPSYDDKCAPSDFYIWWPLITMTSFLFIRMFTIGPRQVTRSSGQYVTQSSVVYIWHINVLTIARKMYQLFYSFCFMTNIVLFTEKSDILKTYIK